MSCWCSMCKYERTRREPGENPENSFQRVFTLRRYFNAFPLNSECLLSWLLNVHSFRNDLSYVCLVEGPDFATVSPKTLPKESNSSGSVINPGLKYFNAVHVHFRPCRLADDDDGDDVKLHSARLRSVLLHSFYWKICRQAACVDRLGLAVCFPTRHSTLRTSRNTQGEFILRYCAFRTSSELIGSFCWRAGLHPYSGPWPHDLFWPFLIFANKFSKWQYFYLEFWSNAVSSL